MPESSEIRVGTVLGETYEITELIGTGGMGAVWAAKHLRLPGKRVAVKVLHGLAANDRESYARFRREAEIASRIGHPNIVTVHDFNVLPSGTPYLVLEFLDGEDLAHRLARGPLPLDKALNLARQIGAALHAAHQAGVVHRDLKPGNVFLVPTELGGELVDHVKVLDFGISKIRGSQTVQTQDSVLLGTPQYMAPEQALGKNAELDARTDLFALGAIVYEMLAGRPAFMGNTLAEVVFKVVYDQQTPLAEVAPGVPAGVAQAVEQALAKDPAQRFADVPAFINALTGRPLQTLDRMRAAKNATEEAFAATQAPTPAPVVPATTGARGELTPAIPPTQAQRAGGANKLVFAGAALAVLIAGGLGVMKMTARAPDVTTQPATRSDAPSPSVPAAKVEPPKAVLPTPPTAIDRPKPPAVELQAAPTTTKPATKKEALPQAVTQELDGAEQLLDAKPDEAIRLARHTLATAKSSRAFSIVARAYCKEGNLGDAKAALHSVGGGDRARVLKYCKSVGTDLQ